MRVYLTTIMVFFLVHFLSAQKHVFYLHGRIVELQGPNAVDSVSGNGAYKYYDILDSLKRGNVNVLSEIRAKNTEPRAYAKKVVKQIDSLLLKKVKPSDITVIGASKGALITMLVSSYLKNKQVNFVILGICYETLQSDFPEMDLYGNILTIYEKTDSEHAQSCAKLKTNWKYINHYKEIELNTGKKHGFLYRPIHEWLNPSHEWIKGNYK